MVGGGRFGCCAQPQCMHACAERWPITQLAPIDPWMRTCWILMVATTQLQSASGGEGASAPDEASARHDQRFEPSQSSTSCPSVPGPYRLPSCVRVRACVSRGPRRARPDCRAPAPALFKVIGPIRAVPRRAERIKPTNRNQRSNKLAPGLSLLLQSALSAPASQEHRARGTRSPPISFVRAREPGPVIGSHGAGRRASRATARSPPTLKQKAPPPPGAHAPPDAHAPPPPLVVPAQDFKSRRVQVRQHGT
jgi:hypothetical protein